MDFLKKLAVK